MFTTNSPAPSSRSPKSPLLKPRSENLIYDIHSTETSANYLLDADILASKKRYLFCSFCQRILQSKAGLTNHEKSHIRHNLKQKRLEKYRKIKKARVYTCRECGEEFDQRGLLNKHVKSHINVIECSICHKTFTDRMEFELHDAISDGKNYEMLNFPAYRTRSQSRLSCHNVSRAVSCDNFINGHKTPLSVYSEMTPNSSQQPRSNSRSTSRLSMSSNILPRRNSKSISDWIENNQYLPTNEFGDTTSVQGYSVRSNNSVSPALTPWSTVTDFMQDRYLCSEMNCMKTFSNLNWVTTHEMIEHKKLPLFRCNECRRSFTTSVNLRHHRINKHPDVLICVLCDHAQNGLAAKEEHIKLHQKYSVKCDVCSKVFLSKYYLDEHLKYKMQRHKNFKQTKGAILIRVDRRETQNCIDVEKHSSKIPDKLKLDYSDYDLCQPESNRRLDNLPWRS